MEDFLMGMVDVDADAELQQAAKVGGDHGLGTSALDVAHFLGEQFERCFCLCDVVDSGGAPADFSKSWDVLRRSFFQKDGGRYRMAPPHSSHRTCLMPQLSEEFSLSSMPSSFSNSRTRPEFIGRRFSRTLHYSEISRTRATPSYGGSAGVC